MPSATTMRNKWHSEAILNLLLWKIPGAAAIAMARKRSKLIYKI
ncbi:hypothetical protein SAMN05428981_102269 [Bacillus sp. OV194]|nr:hypothetical protein SAMN05428981_102269 [Bacillus sp. OV194]